MQPQDSHLSLRSNLRALTPSQTWATWPQHYLVCFSVLNVSVVFVICHSYHATNTDLCLGSSSAGFSGPGYKAAPSAGGPKNSSQQWQQNPRPSSGPNKPWMPLNSASRQQTQPSKPVPQPAKPNYVPSFSVIGGREEGDPWAVLW